MQVTTSAIDAVKLIEPRHFPDSRGFFFESFSAERYRTEVGIELEFVQDNHSRSSAGVLRGLHYQLQHPQGKLVRVVVGEVFDVAVDIRKSSATFGRWVGYHLSAENRRQLWIPPGFAHGFYVVSEAAEVLYKATGYYAPNDSHSLAWNDPEISIDWPLQGQQPLVSDADQAALPLAEIALFP